MYDVYGWAGGVTRWGQIEMGEAENHVPRNREARNW